MKGMKGMKVVWLGMPQIQNLNIANIFKILGYQPYGIFDAVMDKNHVQHWRDAIMDASKLDLSLLDDYDAAVLLPVGHFYRELMLANPDTVFILENMPPQEAYNRYRAIKRLLAISGGVLSIFPSSYKAFRLLRLNVLRSSMGNDGAYAQFETHYTDYIKQIKAAIPAERLLITETQAGWSPICNFLGVAVPAVKFPLQSSPKGAIIYQKTWATARRMVGNDIFVAALYILILIAIATYIALAY